MAVDTSDAAGRLEADKEPVIGKGWVQGVALVLISAFS